MHFSHLHTAAGILNLYRGEQPFHHFIKDYFRQHKKHGSKDRKRISTLCYAYFRLGPSFPGMKTEEKILLGLFLCAARPDELLENQHPGWNAAVQQPLKDKCAVAGVAYEALNIYPFMAALSETIDKEAFVYAHLQQPDLFIRVRPGYEKKVLEKLDIAGEAYRRLDETCIAFSNAAKIDTLLELDKEAVVQDYSSQQVGTFLQSAINSSPQPIRDVWDCCAASGGKSILAKDILGNIHLTVSDVRKQILVNLEKRFSAAGIKNYKSIVLDLAKIKPAGLPADLSAEASAKAGALAKAGSFDLIIADVPCTGSGTWGRTPESLTFFKPGEIDRYQQLQKQIVSNAFPLLKKGRCFLYITCSVFKKENEDMAAFIEEKGQLRLLRMETLKGYDKKADTMFAALFIKE